MKRIISLFVLILILVGCSAKTSTFSLVDAVDRVETQDINLVKIDDIDPEFPFYQNLVGVDPAVFSVNDNQSLSIYVFESSSEVEEAVEEFEEKAATGTLADHERYEINNLLIFYILDGESPDTDVIDGIESIE